MTDTAQRDTGLRLMLNERRRELQDEVRGRMRQGRTDRQHEGIDDLEVSDTDLQDDIGFRLLQMRAETLKRIEEALARLDAEEYGSCIECGCEIAERRLRALPFAVRCQACEGRREQEQAHAQRLAGRGTGLSLFANVAAG